MTETHGLDSMTAPHRRRILDVHTHATGFDLLNLARRRYPTSQSVLDLADRLAWNGVDYAACYPIMTPFSYDLNGMARGIEAPGGPEEYPYAMVNAQHLYECAYFGTGRILPFLAIDPSSSVIRQADYVRAMNDVVFGLKYHSKTSNSHPQSLITSGFLTLAHELDLPITAHSARTPSNCDPESVIFVARAGGAVRVNVAHAAAFQDTSLRLIRDTPNLFVDCAPWLTNLDSVDPEWPDLCPLTYADPAQALYDLYEKVPESLMWGTDTPWTSYADRSGAVVSRHSYEDEVGILRSLPTEVQEKIAWINPCRWLFGTTDEAVIGRVIERRLSSLATHTTVALSDDPLDE
ncbi:MAG: amidohydrolase family protein [Pseudonocardia sp.]